jgi:drug/metabolite transporter (DMT)-like permease
MSPRKDWWHGAALGFVFGLTMIFLFLGLVFTNAARGTIFYSTKPFWVALGAHFFMPDDRLKPFKVAGLGLALFGIYLTFWTPGAAGLEKDWEECHGNLGRPVFLRHRLVYQMAGPTGKAHPFQTLFAMMLFSIPILTAMALFMERDYPVRFSLIDLLAFGYQSLGAQFLAYILWFWLIYRFPVSQVASFTFLVPLVGVILSSIFLREPTPPSLWLGLALVTTGIVLVNWPKRENKLE